MVVKNKQSRETFPKRKIALWVLIVTSASLVGMVGFGSGWVQYGVAYAQCGHAPVAATSFAAAYSYKMPEDASYGPGIFNRYFCTAKEAESSGFRRNVLSDAGRQQSDDAWARYQEEKKFSPSKISYTAYVPSGVYTYGEITIMKMSNGDPHTFFTVKKDGFKIISVREGLIPSDYQLCHSKDYACSVIGKDMRGTDIQKQVSGRKNDIASYSVNIGSTFVIFSGIDSSLSDVDITNAFNSLVEYTNGS